MQASELAAATRQASARQEKHRGGDPHRGRGVQPAAHAPLLPGDD